MKKFVVIMLTVALALAMCAISLAYENSNADWGIKAEVQADGSVIISYDRAKVNASREGWNSACAQIAIYDHDPGFTADSKMADFEGGDQEDYPYSDGKIGQGNAGQTAQYASSYIVNVGEEETVGVGPDWEKGDAGTPPTYPFVEGEQYWIVVCDGNNTDWYWNYVPYVLTYEVPGSESTPTATPTEPATPTATATEPAATETAATTEPAATETAATTTEAAATTAVATGTSSTDDPDNGGDLSILVYAAAVLAAGGGAAIAFRKKNKA